MNQQYLFYNEYYKNAQDGYSGLNKSLIDAKYESSEEKIPLADQSFALKTLYPGMLMGLGYSHEWGEVGGADKESEIKLGFSFDYVTGLPYLPGSSVKGALKSYFEKYDSDIAAMLSLKEDDAKKINEDVVKALKEDIFGDDEGSGKDVFLDAFPIKPDSDKHVLGIDYITSHRSSLGPEYDGLTNPNPVKMLNVLPGVTFLFRFILKDSVIKDIKLGADVKLQLFEETLKLYGVGAKTNVGYGRLKEPEKENAAFTWLTVTNGKINSDKNNETQSNFAKKNDVGQKQKNHSKNAQQKNEEITITAKDLKPDRKDSKKQVSRYQNKMIFNIPSNIKKGDRIIITPQKNGKHYNYAGKA